MTEDIGEFRLAATDFRQVGTGLRRPECVLALSDGTLLAADRTGIVTRIAPDGTQTDHGTGAGLANTLALGPDGQLLVADLARATILTLGRDGVTRILHDNWQGQPLGAVNFCMAGPDAGEFYISVSTLQADFRSAIRDPRPDGRIYRLTPQGLTLCADELWFPNAMQLDPAGAWLYVAETTAGAVARARRRPDGSLGAFERFGPAPLWPGAYTDGLALDSAGNVWVTELSRNAIVVLRPDGRLHPVFEDPAGHVLRSPTHLAFGGPDLRRVHVGSLKMTSLPVFDAPVPGLALPHWRPDLRPRFLAGRAADSS